MVKNGLLLILILSLSAGICLAESYIGNADGTLFDQDTGLLWQQSDDGVKRTWGEALDYCAALTLAGKPWRVPNSKELISIVDYTRKQPAIDPLFTNTKSDSYWTSTTYAGNENWNANYVSFVYGGSFRQSKTSSFNIYVRCVH